MTLTQTDLLAAYAAGETSPGLSLLCAAQIALNPEARAFAAMAEAVAAEAWRAAPETESAALAIDPEALLARLDRERPAGTRREKAAPAQPCAIDPTLPPPVAAIAGRLTDLPWSFRLPGVSEHELAGYAPEKVSLMRVRGGVRIPEHTHRGLEATLVLAGRMKDGDRILSRGDLALSSEAHHHHPEVIGEETCYCLVVMAGGGLRFTGLLGRALNLFT